LRNVEIVIVKFLKTEDLNRQSLNQPLRVTAKMAANGIRSHAHTNYVG